MDYSIGQITLRTLYIIICIVCVCVDRLKNTRRPIVYTFMVIIIQKKNRSIVVISYAQIVRRALYCTRINKYIIFPLRFRRGSQFSTTLSSKRNTPTLLPFTPGSHDVTQFQLRDYTTVIVIIIN